MWAFSERLRPESNHHFAQMYQIFLYLLMARTKQKRGGATRDLAPLRVAPVDGPVQRTR